MLNEQAEAVLRPARALEAGLRAARPALPARALERRGDRPHHGRARRGRAGQRRARALAQGAAPAWLLIGGLRGVGANDDADRLASAVAAAAERSGFREYQHPRTGSGHGAHRFGWSTLLLDLPAGFSAPPAGVAKPT